MTIEQAIKRLDEAESQLFELESSLRERKEEYISVRTHGRAWHLGAIESLEDQVEAAEVRVAECDSDLEGAMV